MMSTKAECRHDTPVLGIFSRPATPEEEESGLASSGKAYVFAKQNEEGFVVVVRLDTSLHRTDDSFVMGRAEFLTGYLLEPQLWYKNVSLNLAQGEQYYRLHQFQKAKTKFEKVLGIDEDNIHASFGLGLVYLDTGQTEKAEYVFEKLFKLDDSFSPEHKHLFNEFGIKLRVNKMYKEAVRYYTKAIALNTSDEHLYFNVARAQYELGLYADAFASLHKALELNPDFKEARRFVVYLFSKGYDPVDDAVRAALRRLLFQELSC